MNLGGMMQRATSPPPPPRASLFGGGDMKDTQKHEVAGKGFPTFPEFFPPRAATGSVGHSRSTPDGYTYICTTDERGEAVRRLVPV